MTFGIISLFLISALAPMSLGYNVKIQNEESIIENFDSYHVTEITSYAPNTPFEDITEPNQIDIPKETFKPLDGPMDSAWPMFKHDIRNTGKSSYNAGNNPGHEIWRFDTNDDECEGCPVIDKDGIIYVGANNFYAIYPNGTLKWKNDETYNVVSAAAIDENGILYIGSGFGGGFYAINPDGSTKWKFPCGDVHSSPVIDSDGDIYFSSENHNIYALYPNGTLKWKYATEYVVYSSPAIGDDGTVYCGSHDTFLYALYPNNGTLKWRFKTGHWIRTSPCIGDDGTIYCVSLDYHLYALYPNGTMKWRSNVGAGTHPSIGPDGTIYCGYDKLKAVNPSDGYIKWSFDPGKDRKIRGGTPCISADGIIIFGTHIDPYYGGELIAVNPDGTERWRNLLATDWIESAPAIAEDGTIYVGSFNDGYHPTSWGYLHAVGKLSPDAPSAPNIDGPTSGIMHRYYDFTFSSTSPVDNQLYYYVSWAEKSYTDWTGPYNSGEEITLSHIWGEGGTFTIRARAKDTDGLFGPWSEFNFNIKARNRASYSNMLLLRFLEQFPILNRLLSLIK